MSIFGVDIGSKNIVVASLNKNSRSESLGCDVLLNENSTRLTPYIIIKLKSYCIIQRKEKVFW